MHKKEKYVNLINEMSRNYRCVRFVNLSVSSLGVFSDECSTFLDMMNYISIDKKQQRYIIKKVINIAITAIYYSTIVSFYHIRSREQAKYKAVIHCSVLV